MTDNQPNRIRPRIAFFWWQHERAQQLESQRVSDLARRRAQRVAEGTPNVGEIPAAS